MNDLTQLRCTGSRAKIYGAKNARLIHACFLLDSLGKSPIYPVAIYRQDPMPLHSPFNEVIALPRSAPAPKDALHRYLEEVASSQPLSAQEEVRLASRIRKGDQKARAKLIEANLRFVISVAYEYQNQGVPVVDLISAGNVGLITAAERFDETRGFKFISYAVWWIRQSILQTLAEHSRVVRLPLNRVDMLRRISRYANRQTSTRPNEEEIAKALGIPVEQVTETLTRGQRVLSLDAPFSDGENSLLDIMPDNAQESPDARVLQNTLKDEITRALSTLDKREQEVIQLYFGLGSGVEMTLEEIGRQFRLTRERVRQIKEKALRKLRHPNKRRKLMPYAEDT